MDQYILLSDIAQKLKPISWDILDMLSKKDIMTYKEIKKKAGVSQDKIVKELARLEGALLITSKKDDFDERKINLLITEAGLNILEYKK